MMYKRSRLHYLFLVFAVMVCGLFSRKFAFVFPGVVNAYLGDALWALMIFVGFGFVFSQFESKRIALFSVLFCYFIECTQLYHAPWIDSIRGTTLGGLVLGYGFLWSDLIAYTIGILFGVILETLWQKISHQKVKGRI